MTAFFDFIKNLIETHTKKTPKTQISEFTCITTKNYFRILCKILMNIKVNCMYSTYTL